MQVHTQTYNSQLNITLKYNHLWCGIVIIFPDPKNNEKGNFNIAFVQFYEYTRVLN